MCSFVYDNIVDLNSSGFIKNKKTEIALGQNILPLNKKFHKWKATIWANIIFWIEQSVMEASHYICTSCILLGHIYMFLIIFRYMQTYRISSNKRPGRLLNFEAVRCGAY